MKKLSIEEKAKAYDEAIKRAQAKMEEAKVFDYDDEQTSHTIRLTTTDIFPELKESEDERIRKEMISWLKGFIREEEGCGYTEDEIRERIAWLEKQSTPQVRTGLEWVNTIDDACDKRYLEEYAHGEYCHEQSFKWGFQEGVDWLEKQGEQKPYGQREECLDCQMNYAGECKGSCAMKRDEQKPAWSEEDENRINRLIAYFEDKESFTAEDDIVYANWLKFLKDRVQPQYNWKPTLQQINVLSIVVKHGQTDNL